MLAVWIAAALVAGCGGLGLATAAPVEITFAYIDKTAEYEPLAEEFHRQHPNITVKLDKVPSTGDSMKALISQAKEADSVRLPLDTIPAELEKGFLPLDGVISADTDFSAEDIQAGALASLKVDGKLIGLPAGLNPFVMYYQPKKLAAAGVAAPSAQWTLEDFVSTAAAVNQTGDAFAGTPRFAYGFCTHQQLPDVILFSYLFGGGLFNSLTQITRPTLNQRANVDALTWYASLKLDYGLLPASGQLYRVGEQIFRGNCAFWIDYLSMSEFGRDGAFTTDAEPLPLPRHVSQFTIATMDGYFIPSTSEHPEEAFLWNAFLMRQQAASGRFIPPTHSAVNSAEYAARVSKPTVAVARSLPEQMVFISMDMYHNERFGKSLALFMAAADQVMNGKADPQAALDEAQRQAEADFQ
jgi:multiple sugar transport system substrate-binding protein